MPLVEYVVNASTSVIQIPTSNLLASNLTPVVLLSNLNLPGQLITIRDEDGVASLSNRIYISTVSGVQFLVGPQVSSYTITQPFGFITVNPRTSSIWNVLNTYAFPESNTAANVETLNTTILYASTLYATGDAVVSTLTVSTLNVEAFITMASTSVGDMLVSGSAYIGSNLSTATLNAGDLSTGTLTVFSSATISSLTVTGAISSLGSLGTSSLSVSADATFDGSMSTLSNLGVGGGASIQGSLSTFGHVYVGSNLTAGGSLSSLGHGSFASNLAVGGSVSSLGHGSFASNLAVGGYLSSASIITGQISTVNLFVGNPAFGGTALFNSFVQIKNTLSCSVVETANLYSPNFVLNSGRIDDLFLTNEAYFESTIVVLGQSYFSNDVTITGNAQIDKLLNASSISTTGSLVVGASLVASSFNTGVLQASSLTIMSNLSVLGSTTVTQIARFASSIIVNSTITGNLIVASNTVPITQVVKLLASTVADGCAITHNVYTGGILGGTAYTELISAKGSGVGGFSFYTAVPNNSNPVASNLAMYIASAGQNCNTLTVRGGATFTSSITANNTLTVTNTSRNIRLFDTTANQGCAITWNSYGGSYLGNGNTEVISAKGTGGEGGFAFFTNVPDSTAAAQSNLAVQFYNRGAVSNTLIIYGGATFTSTIVGNSGLSLTGPVSGSSNYIFNTTLFSTNAPVIFNGGASLAMTATAGSALFSNGVGFVSNVVSFSYGSTIYNGGNTPQFWDGFLCPNSGTSNIISNTTYVAGSVTFSNNVTFTGASFTYPAISIGSGSAFSITSVTFNPYTVVTFNSNTVAFNGATTTFSNTVNFSNATVQGLSYTFPVTTL